MQHTLNLQIFPPHHSEPEENNRCGDSPRTLQGVVIIEDLVAIIKDKMSSDNAGAEAADNCCASCGIAEVDDIKLKKCDGCDLVKYCSDDCQEDHRSDHEAKCKERAVELRDELLFKQPDSNHYGDCPICSLPLPIDREKSVLKSCCSKIICNGCELANDVRQLQENMERICPFCRHPAPKSQEEADRNLMKRVEANDPAAIREFGKRVHDNGDYDGAFRYFTKAAALGDASAHYDLSIMYMKGEGVEKNEKKAFYHMEEAAIRGHAYARHNLGVYEGRKGRIERAVKHLIIAANLGDDEPLQALNMCYKNGDVSKEDFVAALRARKAAVDATKSPQREVAAKYYSAQV